MPLSARSADLSWPRPAPTEPLEGPRAQGKFLFVGERKLHLCGVTYGTFSPGSDGSGYPARGVVRQDFALMTASGVNAIRTYTVPPHWLLDQAALHGLRVLVGLPWEHHVAFMDHRATRRGIMDRVRKAARGCARHPAILGYTVGNEIPGPIVRWTGRSRVERYLERLADAVKGEDPDALVTYGNYPTTEYLDLPFLDFVCFNVYLERPDRLEAYLARLQNLAGDRPLVLGEIGLDSRTHGLDAQARAIQAQLRTTFDAGCAGAFVFSWTDEWHRGGHDVTDWDFGLTTRTRQPKPALAAFRSCAAEEPGPRAAACPKISVVVCAFNAAATLGDCLEGATQLRYPDYEVVVVDDGSTDETALIARQYPVCLVRTENHGLSNARNRGIQEASGEIVAFLDADARPDPDWLTYVAHTFETTDFMGVGGPNLPPPDDGLVADCVAHSPGGPVHILVSDREAEHIPGCNMAFRKEALEAVGGFDARFRVAGDDVDLCWSLQERGWRLGFHPAAVVWHHHRDSVRAYWRQQWGYGKAEALLEAKWPEKYNAAGHVTWGGRVYRRGLPGLLGWTSRIYHGTWGEAPFQSRDPRRPSVLWSLTATPEWYLIVAALGFLATMGLAWRPLLVALPAFLIAGGAVAVHALAGVGRSRVGRSREGRPKRILRFGLTAFLHLLQPAARLLGRLSYGLTPWRSRHVGHFAVPLPRVRTIWSERWRSGSQRLAGLERELKDAQAVVRRGGAYDRWDLEVRGGSSGRVRILQCVEEHGDGKQLVRIRLRPSVRGLTFGSALTLAMLAAWAAVSSAWPAAWAMSAAVLWFVLVATRECGAAMAVGLEAVDCLRVQPADVEHELPLALDPGAAPTEASSTKGNGCADGDGKSPEATQARPRKAAPVPASEAPWDRVQEAGAPS